MVSEYFARLIIKHGFEIVNVNTLNIYDTTTFITLPLLAKINFVPYL